MELRGPTLTLRPPTRDDVPALFALGSDPEVTRWFSWGPYENEREPAEYVRRARQRSERGDQLDLLVVHHEDGPIGVTGLSEWSVRDRRAVVGTWFGRRWWGTGVNAQSKALVAHLAFGVYGLQRLGAYADVQHLRSQRALEGLGFTREGILRGYHRHGDVQKDVVLHSLLRADWERDPRWDVPVELDGAPPAAFRVL